LDYEGHIKLLSDANQLKTAADQYQIYFQPIKHIPPDIKTSFKYLIGKLIGPNASTYLHNPLGSKIVIQFQVELH
jgi:hypothetical protein